MRHKNVKEKLLGVHQLLLLDFSVRSLLRQWTTSAPCWTKIPVWASWVLWIINSELIRQWLLGCPDVVLSFAAPVKIAHRRGRRRRGGGRCCRQFLSVVRAAPSACRIRWWDAINRSAVALVRMPTPVAASLQVGPEKKYMYSIQWRRNESESEGGDKRRKKFVVPLHRFWL